MKKAIIFVILLLLIAASSYYYITLPAINIHAAGCWILMLSMAVVFQIYALIRVRFSSRKTLKDRRRIKLGFAIIIAIIFSYGAGTVLSSPVINTNRYQQLMQLETSDFEADIEPLNYQQLILSDHDSAVISGSRKMGYMAEMVSQFEVSERYSQCIYQHTPVRVTPLVYASPVKWLTNHRQGIPAYIKINLATQETELVQLSDPIRYSESEYLFRNIHRHIRYKYPFYSFDKLSFEIDDQGVPYWICPVKQYQIGLFGGQTIGRVVICNAVTGVTWDYPVAECPSWVDCVYRTELLTRLYNYHGQLVNGYINSVFGQRGCLQTSAGYNYLVMNDDIWVYAGITSLSDDESNVGFVLMNQRTMESRYYDIHGADEQSAMASAQGQVQHLGYRAVFPTLVNVSGEPTYLLALKDNAGLVKKYAMVSIQKYQNVATGDTVKECENEYLRILGREKELDKETAYR